MRYIPGGTISSYNFDGAICMHYYPAPCLPLYTYYVLHTSLLPPPIDTAHTLNVNLTNY